MGKYENRDLNEEFYGIISPKDCKRYSKAAKDNLEEAVGRLSSTRRDLVRHLNGEGYTQDKYPEVTSKTLDYYDEVIDSYKKSLENLVKKGEWSFRAPSSPEEKNLKEFAKSSYFFNGSPEKVTPCFEKVSKNLLKNGFSSQDLSSKKEEEEEAKKPKMPETIKFVKSESFDPSRMKNYEPGSRGEKMAHSAFLTKRSRSIYSAKQLEDRIPGVSQYVQDVFNALDNAWFSYVGRETPSVDFKEVNKIYDEWVSKEPKIEKFNSRVCGQSYVSGGSFTLWDCEDSLSKMASNREKLVQELTFKEEDTYSLWEKSIDSILDKDGKPSLNAYLDKWVEEITQYFTNKKNLNMWSKRSKDLEVELKSLKQTLKNLETKWVEDHRGNNNMTWYDANYGYRKDDDYLGILEEKNATAKTKQDVDRNLSIGNLGKEKVKKMFQDQAAEVKKSFVTAVCSKSGPVKEGTFYWSEQNTGHLNGIVTGEDGKKWKVTSFFAGGYNIQKLHTRTKITNIVS